MPNRSLNADAAVPAPLRIGQWKADPATNELSRGSETVRIEPKAMDVLMLLALRAGAVVGREELLAAVWAGTVVGDEALTQSITKLRRALGDDPRSPSYIETISKRGYRLIAQVQGNDAVQSMRGTVEPTSPPQRTRRPLRSRAVVAALAFPLGVAGVYFFQFMALPVATQQAVEPDDERRGAWVTVAVLPFEPLGAGGEHAYLAHGISDNLTTDLARLSGLRLIRPAGVAGVARAPPGARYIVSGSVQREADILRINVHLIDARTDEQLWSERFERPFGELFAMQDEINRRLTESLPARMSDAERQRLAKRYTRSLEAYDHFLRAQALFLARGLQENQEARDLYRRALEVDPKFARAYAGLAMTYAMDYRLRWTADALPGLDRAFELAESARLIDPDIAEVHWALGFVHAQSRRHEQAAASVQRAIELNRSFADAYALMGGIHTYVGQPAKSIPLLRTAMRFNPDGGYLYFLLLGRAYLFENDIEQALINLRQSVVRNPADLEGRIYLAAAMAAAGDRSGAEWEAEEIRSLEPAFSTRSWLESYPLTSARHRERLLELLATAGL